MGFSVKMVIIIIIIIIIIINVGNVHIKLFSDRSSMVSNTLQYQNAPVKWLTYLTGYRIFLFLEEFAWNIVTFDIFALLGCPPALIGS
jgi:hypothetical protein